MKSRIASRIRAIAACRGVCLTATSFSPASLPGYVTHVDVAALRAAGLLFQNTAETTGAVANNDPVRVISGPGYKWTAPSDSARGLLKNSGNRWWIEFDGSDDQYDSSLTLTGAGATNAFSVGVSVLFGSPPDYRRAIADWGSSSKSFVLGTTFGSSKPLLEVQTTTSAGALGPSNLSASQWYSLIGKLDSGSTSLYLDGSSIATATLSGTLNTGAGISLGVGRDGGRLLGRIAGFYLGTAALSESQITLLNTWLQSLYA